MDGDFLSYEPNALHPDCPSRRLLGVIANRWTMLIVYVLAHGTKRHGELLREVGGVSQKVLTQTLRGLENEGLVARTAYPVVPPMVEYELTARGRALIEPLTALVRWAEGTTADTLHEQSEPERIPA